MLLLESLSAELFVATETRDAFAARLQNAEAALTTAVEHRASLIRQTTRGVEISPKALKDAGLALAAAEDGLSLLNDQIAEAGTAYNLAKAAYDEAMQAQKLHAVAVAQRGVIASGDLLAHHGAMLATAGANHMENYRILFAAMGDAGRVPRDHEIQAYQSLKVRIPGAVPADFQNRIIAGGAVRSVDVGQFERSTWLHGAAPDTEADAPYNERARIQAEQIEAQQALERAGRKQNEISRREVPSWSPTEMQPKDARYRSGGLPER